eukprot:CAMPEP_0171490274 /NCGR_PEP_ID=MMETSP0958-20121227/3212_1 /TAXON_ID=87120 /ORGANISM="Aurantiochytrium limacinum, Strain ATCCMYA-1381" /LENGTH=520 /DNA_ID=CAMNT_0012023561 /DNA_START=423 /DNA_END=1982 /DNA_ORIENTATION=+
MESLRDRVSNLLLEGTLDRNQALEELLDWLRNWRRRSSCSTEELLEALAANDVQNSLAMLFVILKYYDELSKTNNSKSILATETNLDVCLKFLNGAQEAEISSALPELALLTNWICLCVKSSTLLASVALDPVRRVMLLSSQNYPGFISPVHVHYLQVALVAKQYRDAAMIAESPTYSALPFTPPLDLQRYFYYSGRVFVGLHRFDEACTALEMVLTLPAKYVSAVVVASYKLLVLASLIGRGCAPKLPAATVSVVQNALARHEPIPELIQYTLIARAFETGERQLLRSTLLQFEQNIIRDNNLGLAKQLDRALLRQRMRDLRGIYKTLHTSDFIPLLEAPPIRKKSTLSNSSGASGASGKLRSLRPGRSQGPEAQIPVGVAGSGAATGETIMQDSLTMGESPSPHVEDNNTDTEETPSATTKTFAAPVKPLTIADIEDLLWELIESDDFPVSIAQDTGIVTLLPAHPDQAARDATALEMQMGDLQRILEDLHKLDTKVSTSKPLVHQLMNLAANIARPF